jgi:hypothetical protein
MPVTLVELAADPSRATTLTGSQAAAVLTEMAALQTVLAARLAAADPTPDPSSDGAGLLTADEVAAILQKPRHSVYQLARRADWRSFTVPINKKTLRFREAGFRRWLTKLTKQP